MTDEAPINPAPDSIAFLAMAAVWRPGEGLRMRTLGAGPCQVCVPKKARDLVPDEDVALVIYAMDADKVEQGLPVGPQDPRWESGNVRPITIEPRFRQRLTGVEIAVAGAILFGDDWLRILAPMLGVPERALERWAVGPIQPPAGAQRLVLALLLIHLSSWADPSIREDLFLRLASFDPGLAGDAGKAHVH